MEVPEFGTYIGVKLHPDTCRALYNYATRYKFLNLVEPQDYHVTVIYSKKPIDYYPLMTTIEPVVFNKGWRKTTIFGKNERVIVIEFSSPFLVNRNKMAIQCGGITDFPNYKPHISLTKNLPPNYELPEKLRQFDRPIRIVEEYLAPLKVNWGK